MTSAHPLVALVHATPAAIGPATTALAAAFPSARRRNLLDDTLISDAEQAGGVTPPLRRRMRELIGYAVDSGADAVLLSCSMYGPVVDEVAAEPGRRGVPVLSSDGALFDDVAALSPARVHVLGPVEAGTADTVGRLRTRLGSGIEVVGETVTGARRALGAGELDRAGEMVADACRRAVDPERGPGADVVVLGQFSLSPTHGRASAAVAAPVLAPLGPAVRALRAALGTPE